MDEEQEKRVKLQNKKQETELMFELTTLKEQIERYKQENKEINEYINDSELYLQKDIKEWDKNILAKQELIEKLQNEIKDQEDRIQYQEERKIKIIELDKYNNEQMDKHYSEIIKDLQEQIQEIKDQDYLRYQFNSEKRAQLEKEKEQLQKQIQEVRSQKEEIEKEIKDDKQFRKEEIIKNSNQEIFDTKNRLLALQQDELDPIIKVNVLQNHQLTTELQYQQNQFQIIKDTNKELKEEIQKLVQEIKVHQSMEEELSHKIVQQKNVVTEMTNLKKKQLDITQNLEQEIKQQKIFNESLLNQVSRNQVNSNFKFKKLEQNTSKLPSKIQSLHSNTTESDVYDYDKGQYIKKKEKPKQPEQKSINEHKSIVDIYNDSIILYKDQEQFSKVQETMATFIKRYMSRNNKFSKDWNEQIKLNQRYRQKLKSQKNKNQLFVQVIDDLHKSYSKIYYKNLQELGITPHQLSSRNTQQNKTQQSEINEEDQEINKQDDQEDTNIYFNLNEIKTTDVLQWTFQQKLAILNILKVQGDKFKEDILQTQIKEEENEETNYDNVQMQIKIIDLKPEPLLTNKNFRLSKQQKKNGRYQSTPQLLKPFKSDSEYGIQQQRKQQLIKSSVNDSIQQLKYERFLKRLPRNNSITTQRYEQFGLNPNYDDSIVNKSNISTQKRLNSISSIQNSIIKNTQNLNITRDGSILNQNSIINAKNPGQILDDQLHDFNFLESELLNTKDTMEKIKESFKQILKSWQEKIDDEFKHEQPNQDLQEILTKILNQDNKNPNNQEENKLQTSNILDDLKNNKNSNNQQKIQEEEQKDEESIKNDEEQQQKEDQEIIKILN